MNKLIEIAIENKDRLFKKEDYYVLAVKILIERKLKIKINPFKDKWTRSDSDKYDLMLMLSHQKTIRRKIINAKKSTSKKNARQVQMS